NLQSENGMAVELVMPKWGLSMQEGLIGQWLKREGDWGGKGEPVLEVGAEKINNLVGAPAAGIPAGILCPACSTGRVSRAIAVVAAPDEAVPEIDTAPISANGGGTAPIAAPAASPAAPAAALILAMPAARRVAKEHGVDLATVAGSGPNGTITREDVERA